MPEGGAPGLLEQHPWVLRHRLDVDAYYRMAEAGILREKERVELIEGEIIALEPISPGHAAAVTRLNHYVQPRLADRAIVAIQGPLRLSRITETVPDLALLRPRADFYRSEHPTATEVLLLVEVAQSSLRYDRGVKLPLYARHGVPEAWIVDIAGGVVEVHREPGPDGYASSATRRPGEAIEPALLPGLSIAVSDILG